MDSSSSLGSTVTVPSLLANLNHACYGCGTLKSPTHKLLRCAGCRRVSYCGTDCQKHKKLCKGFCAAIAHTSADIDLTTHASPDVVDPSKIPLRLERISDLLLADLSKFLGRPVNFAEQNLVVFEPRCLACGRSDPVLLLQAKKSGSTASLQQCPDCKLSFYCSKDHWDLARHDHQDVPCPTGLNGLSQCETNRIVFEDTKLIHVRAQSNLGEYHWTPNRTKAAWTPLRNVGWSDFEGEFREHDQGALEHSPSRDSKFRSATEGLSMPMTILWALENLNLDDSWTKKEVLIIHIIGANQKEVDHTEIFEEILHRLPEVNTLKLELVSPMLMAKTSTIIMNTCPDCKKNKRKWIQVISADNYETYVRKQMLSFKKPDLAVAFNSGASGGTGFFGTYLHWMGIMKFLVSSKIPCLFTSYNKHEANVEANMLRKAGASLHPDLGPTKNPWGSMLLKPEPNKVGDFYSHNAWLAGGLC